MNSTQKILETGIVETGTPREAQGTVRAFSIASSLSETNPVQKAAVNPRATSNLIYAFMAALFCVALMLNILIKIQIQHAQLIIGGLFIIFLAVALIIVNNQILSGVVVR